MGQPDIHRAAVPLHEGKSYKIGSWDALVFLEKLPPPDAIAVPHGELACAHNDLQRLPSPPYQNLFRLTSRHFKQ